MKYIHIEGTDSKNRPSHIDYEYPIFCGKYSCTDFEAIVKAMRWADDEYSCEFDENDEYIPNSDYKNFEEIKKVEIVEY